MKPAFCPFIYHDGQTIFLEFDTMALEFPLTEGGLSKALQHIPNITAQPGYLSGGRNILPTRRLPKGYVARKTAQPRVARSTEAQRIQDRLSGKVKATVADLIRKAKL